MARTQIPVHITKKDGGGVKIITAKKRVEEMGVNAYIVSAATVKKLDAPKKEEEPTIDADKMAAAIIEGLRKSAATILPRNAGAVIKKAIAES